MLSKVYTRKESVLVESYGSGCEAAVTISNLKFDARMVETDEMQEDERKGSLLL